MSRLSPDCGLASIKCSVAAIGAGAIAAAGAVAGIAAGVAAGCGVAWIAAVVVAVVATVEDVAGGSWPPGCRDSPAWYCLGIRLFTNLNGDAQHLLLVRDRGVRIGKERVATGLRRERHVETEAGDAKLRPGIAMTLGCPRLAVPRFSPPASRSSRKKSTRSTPVPCWVVAAASKAVPCTM